MSLKYGLAGADLSVAAQARILLSVQNQTAQIHGWFAQNQD